MKAPALFYPKGVSPQRGLEARGEGVLGCAEAVRALGGGQIPRGRGSACPLPRVPLGHLARQEWRDSGTEKLCPIS